MKQYHKIESLFKRDTTGTQRLIEGNFRNPTVEYLKDNEWIFTEKIDGTNIRIFWDGHKVSFNGRTDNANLNGGLVQKLTELFLTPEAEELFEQKFGEIEVILFGEGYGPKIQAGGGLYSDEKGFVLFDVSIRDTWLSRDNVEDIAIAFKIPVVPVVVTGTIQQAVEYVKSKPRSMFAKQEMITEGVVGTPKTGVRNPDGSRVIVKIKCKDY